MVIMQRPITIALIQLAWTGDRGSMQEQYRTLIRQALERGVEEQMEATKQVLVEIGQREHHFKGVLGKPPVLFQIFDARLELRELFVVINAHQPGLRIAPF